MDTEKPLLAGTTRPSSGPARSLLLGAAFAVLLSRYCIATFLSAFFSPLAEGWGLSPTFNGAIFAAYPLGMAIVSVFAPHLIEWLGTSRAVALGMHGGAALTVVYGAAPDIVDCGVSLGIVSEQYATSILGGLFLGTYFLNGTIGALAETACIILITQRFSDRLGAVMASVGSVCAVGCMVGPLIGGVLYDAVPEALGERWKFRCPFFVCALVSVAIAVPIHLVIPNERIAADAGDGGVGGKDNLVLSVLSPSVCLNLFAVAFSGTAVATLDPTLPYRLSSPPFRLSATAVSLFFFFSSLVYVAVSVPIGALVDRYTGRADAACRFKTITGLGFLVLALSFAMLAPLQLPPSWAPALSAAVNEPLNSIAVVAAAMLVKGMGSALSGNAVYPDLVVGFPEEDAMAHATISALWNAAYAIGWAFGPLLGGLLYDALGPAERGRLCTGAQLASCAADGPAASAASGADGTIAASECLCEWSSRNGFDSFAQVVAFGCLLVGILCLAAAACSLPGGYRTSAAQVKSASEAASPNGAMREGLLSTGTLSSHGSSASSLAPLSMSRELSETNLAELLRASELAVAGPWASGRLPGLMLASPSHGIDQARRNGMGKGRSGSGGAPRVLSKAPSHRLLPTARRTGGSTLATSVDAALEAIGFGPFHLFSLPVLCLASMAQSLQTNLLSYTQVCAAEAFQVPAEEASVLASVVFLATLPSVLLFGLLADSKGRKPATILSIVLMVAANVGSSSASSFGALVAFQALAGVGLGGTMVPFDLLAELSPPSVRGSVLNASNWMWSVGTLLVAGLASLSVAAGREGWRVLINGATVPLGLTLMLAPWLTESPHWLLQRKQVARAAAVLSRMARANGIELPQLLEHRAAAYEPPASPAPLAPLEPPTASPIVAAGMPPASHPCTPSPLSSTDALPALPQATTTTVAPIPPSLADAVPPSVPGIEGIEPGQPHGSTVDPVKDAKAPLHSTGQGLRMLFADRTLRSRALLHWTLWAVSGFGWTALVFFATFVTSGGGAHADGSAEPRPGGNASHAFPATALYSYDDGNASHDGAPKGSWRPLDKGGCSFDYRSQILVVGSEVPGVLLVQLFIDRPWGPFGLLGGRRGCQVVAYLLCGVFAALMASEALIGQAGVLAVSMLSRAALAAGNSAMWVAAPEQYPTITRGLGANAAFLANVLGSIPASQLVYAPLPRPMVAAAIGAANALAGLLALAIPETAGIDLE